MAFWNKFKEQFSGVLGQTLLLIFGIIMMLFIVYLLTWVRSGATYESLAVKEPQFHIDTVGVDTNQRLVFVDEFRAGSMQIHPELAKHPSIDRLIQQLGLVRMRAYHHQNYYVFFYRMRYGLSIIQAFASLFAVVLALLVTREGWSNASRFHLVAFFVFSSFAALLQLIPESLSLDSNITTNTTQYERHNTLEGEILTYLSTGLTKDEHEMDVPGFVVYTDSRIRSVQRISLTLNDFPAHRIQEKLTEIDQRLQQQDQEEETSE